MRASRSVKSALLVVLAMMMNGCPSETVECEALPLFMRSSLRVESECDVEARPPLATSGPCTNGSFECVPSDGAVCTDDSECESEYQHCDEGVCVRLGFAYAPAGEFVMGAPQDEPGRHSERENGQHTVELTSGFVVSETVVTQAQWREVMNTSPSYFTGCGDECPVERVSHWDALVYANLRSLSEGLSPCYAIDECNGAPGIGCSPDSLMCEGFRCDVLEWRQDCDGYRLLTEAEWEYVARAGRQTAFLTESGELLEWDATPLDDEMDRIAWYSGNSSVDYTPSVDCSMLVAGGAEQCGTHPVATKEPNAWGLFDMTGNVWEWVWDYSAPYPDPGSRVVDPRGPTTPDEGNRRRMRGGTAFLSGQYLRVAYRTGPAPGGRLYTTGFRIARTLSAGP